MTACKENFLNQDFAVHERMKGELYLSNTKYFEYSNTKF